MLTDVCTWEPTGAKWDGWEERSLSTGLGRMNWEPLGKKIGQAVWVGGTLCVHWPWGPEAEAGLPFPRHVGAASLAVGAPHGPHQLLPVHAPMGVPGDSECLCFRSGLMDSSGGGWAVPDSAA